MGDITRNMNVILVFLLLTLFKGLETLSPPAPELGPPCKCPSHVEQVNSCTCLNPSSSWMEPKCICDSGVPQPGATCQCRVYPRFVLPPCPVVLPQPPGHGPISGGRPGPMVGPPGSQPLVGPPGSMTGRRPYPCLDGPPALPGPPAFKPECQCS